jgi:hypothetical protein
VLRVAEPDGPRAVMGAVIDTLSGTPRSISTGSATPTSGTSITVSVRTGGKQTGTGALCLQQTTLQQCLHIAAPVGNHQDIKRFGHDPVNDAVGFEIYLAVLTNPDG